jgi:predicted Zn-ribbon and HTH transcriptional regulator
MPLLIKCRKCGFNFTNIKEKLISPMDIVRRYERCPRCLSKLKRSNFEVILSKN